MIPYLIKSTLCLVLLYAVYRLFLEKEKMHRFNRYFLLGSVIFSLTVPLFSFNFGFQPFPDIPLTDQSFIATEYDAERSASPNISASTNRSSSPAEYYFMYAVTGYLLGVLVMSTRFIGNLHSTISTIRSNPRIQHKEAHVVLLENAPAPYSFLRYIFLDRADFQAEHIERTILDHEITHVRQYHTLDILVMELILIAFWFNPVLYFYKKSIQLNHEFIADEAVLSKSNDVPRYQRLLLKMSSAADPLQLASSINFSTTKKRLLMMTHTPNKSRIVFKKIVLIPALACLFFLTTAQTHGQDVQSLSLTELMNTVYTKLKSTNSLTEAERTELQALIEKMQQQLAATNATAAQERSTQGITQQQEAELAEAFEQFKLKNRAYGNVVPDSANLEKLESAYAEMMEALNKFVEKQKEIYGKDAPPAPPRYRNPEWRIANHD